MSGIDYTGQTIDGRYRVVRLLGKGGMGSVYLGQHIVIGKQVAIKFLHAEFAHKEGMVRRFYREAQAAAAIGHKNIIDVADVGVSEKGEPYLVMEYLVGESLSGMLARTGPIDCAAACGILEPVLKALAEAHDKGIVHRDLKPDNIFMVVEPGEAPTVKLIDFGISKFIEDAGQTKLTQTGAMIGTPAYMSPEQAKGVGDVDHRADLYSVGVILYEMLSGGLPFVGAHYNQLLVNLLTSSPRPPREVHAGFPAEAEDLVMALLAKDPDGRPQSAGELLVALQRLGSYGQRQERLTHFASGMETKTIAAGDLGETAVGEGSGEAATDVLSELAAQGTPQGWARTETRNRPGRRVLWGSIGAAAIIGVVVILLLRVNVNSSDDVAPPPSSSAEPNITGSPDGVRIEVKGAPPGAKIFYDNAPVPMNPFRVDKKTTLQSLRVQAAEHDDFITSLVPDRDQVVRVELAKKTAEATRPKKTGASKRSENTRREKDSSSKNTPEKSSRERSIHTSGGTNYAEDFEPAKKINTSKRGTKFAEDFE